MSRSPMYKVFIPCAGIGSRLGELTFNLNKALVSVAGKPAISHIIEKFDESIEFVIALGYKGDYVKQFLQIAYPQRKFEFIEILNYDGPGSGLGLTILECQKVLQCPFIFISNDTIIEGEIPNLAKMFSLKNWVGYAGVPAGIEYRGVLKDEQAKLIRILDKKEDILAPAYIGLCGISDYEEFWEIANQAELREEVIRLGESFIISEMNTCLKFHTIVFNWLDIGNKNSLNVAGKKLNAVIDANILYKEDEAIWFVNGQAIKFHKDEEFISKRVSRSKILAPFCPEVSAATKNMYAYPLVEGFVMSKNASLQNIVFFLEWMKTFWAPKYLLEHETASFKQSCLEFYKEKTYQRIDKYFKTFNCIDSSIEMVNGIALPSIQEILSNVDWESVCDGRPTRFHGDLHFENVLIRINSQQGEVPFVLLDWRQDFAGEETYGDVYYDLAKLLHGMIVAHDLVSKNAFSFSRNMNEVRFDFLRKNINIEAEELFEKFCIENHYDFRKVKILTALIFLNIAALHHYPYCHMLFYLGKMMLFKEVNDARLCQNFHRSS